MSAAHGVYRPSTRASFTGKSATTFRRMAPLLASGAFSVVVAVEGPPGGADPLPSDAFAVEVISRRRQRTKEEERGGKRGSKIVTNSNLFFFTTKTAEMLSHKKLRGSHTHTHTLL